MRQVFFVLAILPALFTAEAAPATELLKRSGKSVEHFWNQFSAVNCVETVSQAKLGQKGKTVLAREDAFDYLVVLQLSGDDLTVSESRVPLKEAPAGPPQNLPLLVTSGFSTLQLIFHPFFQNSFEYSEPVRVIVNGRELLEVQFRHVRGTRSPSVLRLRNREYPVEWQGKAWIDPASFSIVRIAAGLPARMEDLGLNALNADVTYGRVEFKEDPGLHYLPQTATIEVETVRQHWRNVHKFSNYRHFSVDVKTDVETPK